MQYYDPLTCTILEYMTTLHVQLLPPMHEFKDRPEVGDTLKSRYSITNCIKRHAHSRGELLTLASLVITAATLSTNTNSCNTQTARTAWQCLVAMQSCLGLTTILSSKVHILYGT